MQTELHDALAILRRRRIVEDEEKIVRRQIKEGQVALMKEELRGMRRVLRRLGHLSEDGVIGNKGRVACEVIVSLVAPRFITVIGGTVQTCSSGCRLAFISIRDVGLDFLR